MAVSDDNLIEILQLAGFKTLTSWALAAGVPRQRIFQFRHDGVGLAEHHVVALARAVGIPASTVRKLLRPRSPARGT